MTSLSGPAWSSSSGADNLRKLSGSPLLPRSCPSRPSSHAGAHQVAGLLSVLNRSRSRVQAEDVGAEAMDRLIQLPDAVLQPACDRLVLA